MRTFDYGKTDRSVLRSVRGARRGAFRVQGRVEVVKRAHPDLLGLRDRALPTPSALRRA